MRRHPAGYRPALGALVLFGALAALFFWPLFAPRVADRAMVGPADGDFMRQFYPYRAFVARAWASGQPPVWNPHQYAGTPALADPQQAVLYPWRLAQATLAVGGRTLPVWAVDLEAVAHLALGGWLTWLLLRQLGASRAASVLGGVTFAFGGYLTGYPVEQLAVLDTAIWLPATLAALTGAGRAARAGDARATTRWAVLAALATALSVLAGHPQTALYGLYAAVAWWLSGVWRAGDGRRRVVASGITWLGLAAGLSAAQWLPALALARRAAPRFDPTETLSGLPVGDVAQVLAPGVVSWWSPLFVGVLPLALVAWGLGVRRAPETRFWAALAGGAWLVALGGHNPVFPVLLRLVPGLALFRHHERAAVVFSLALAVAAGLGADRLLASGRDRLVGAARWAGALAVVAVIAAAATFAASGGGAPDRAAQARAWCAGAAGGAADATDDAATSASGAVEVAGSAVDSGAGSSGAPASLAAATADPLVLAAIALGIGAALIALRASGRLSARALGAGLVAIVLVELWSANQGRVLCPQTDVFRRDGIVDTLADRARDGRVSSEARLPGGPNAASVHGLYDVTGDSPLRLAAIDRLGADVPEIVLWRLLGVRYVVSDRTFPADAPVTQIARDGDRALYETRLAVPPAWVPARVALTSTGGPWAFAPPAGYDPLARVELEVVGPVDDAGRLVPRAGSDTVLAEAASAEQATTGDARLVALDPGHIVVEATLDRAGVVVASSVYDPGWRAVARSVGADGPVERPGVRAAYGALLAVALPAGEWRVEWTYRPIEAILGLAVSMIAALACVIGWRPSRGESS